MILIMIMLIIHIVLIIAVMKLSILRMYTYIYMHICFRFCRRRGAGTRVSPYSWVGGLWGLGPGA